MMIFGIGMSKTGTKSLKFALNSIGFKILHWPNDIATYRELSQGKYKLSILKNHNGITDGIAPFYAQLDQAYPQSKFILTVRETGWEQSIRSHWETVDPVKFEKKRQEGSPFHCMAHFYHSATYGCVFYNPERYLFAYQQHKDNVLRYFRKRPKDLLVIDICRGEGWEKLCSFLGKDIPSQTFPWKNRNDDTEKILTPRTIKIL